MYKNSAFQKNGIQKNGIWKKKIILKERYLINRPRPLNLTRNTAYFKYTSIRYIEKKTKVELR
jgi:hypothetical protein